MSRYNHLVSIGFTVISDHPEGTDFTPAILRTALIKRIHDLDRHQDEWLEAVGIPDDTFMIEKADRELCPDAGDRLDDQPIG